MDPITILLAEDEEALRRVITRVLRKNGYVVLSARSGSDAVAIAANAPRIDLLIADLIMPGISGPATADQVAGHVGDLPVLFMTGYAPAAVAAQGTARKDSMMLRKPFTPADLEHAVTSILQRSRR